MSRKGRKATRSAKLGWKEIRGALLTLLRWLWAGLCLLRYLNPLHYVRLLPRRKGSLDTAASAIYRPSLWERMTQVFRSDASDKRQLLAWAQSQLPAFRIINFTGCWTDGIALCALVDSVSPGACPRYDLLKPHHKVNNCRLGLKLAQRYLGIPSTIITPEEMALAASAHIEDKMRQFVSQIRWSAVVREAEGDDEDGTGHGSRWLPDAMKNLSSCSAKGSGLVVGLVGKRCKFDIYTPVTELLDLVVEIKGPNEDFCSEKLESVSSRRRASHTLNPEDVKHVKTLAAMDNGIQFSSPTTTTTTTSSTSSSSSSSKNTDGDRIPFDYQCIGESHFVVSYMPRSEGTHLISIRWKGGNIRGSPFRVMVASTLEKLNVESKNKLRHKHVSFNEDEGNRRRFYQSVSPYEDEDKDEAKENVDPVLGNVTAAVLNRSSKVHRSISTTAAPGKLTKQATVTRRRVLKRVITKGGQEIVIHEIGASPNSSRQNSNDISRQSSMELSRQSSLESAPFSRPESPASQRRSQIRHQNKSFDFEMVSDDTDNERSASPAAAAKGATRQNSADNVAGTMVETIMEDVFRMLQMNEVKEKLLKGQNLKFRRRDDHKPVIATRSVPHTSARQTLAALLEHSSAVQDQSKQTKPGILSVSSYRDSLQSVPEKDVLPTRETTNTKVITPISILNHLTKFAEEKAQQTPSSGDSETPTNNKNSHKPLTSTNSMQAGQTSLEKSHKKLGLSLTVPTSTGSALCLPTMDNAFEKERMPPRSDQSLNSPINHSSRRPNSLNPENQQSSPQTLGRGLSCDDSALGVKTPLSKTLSDPTRTKKHRLVLQRSNTTPNSPTGVLKSNSLAEQCAVMMEPETPGLRVLQSPSLQKSCFYNSQNALTDSTQSGDGIVPASPDADKANKPMMWRTRKLAHRLSSSLPTLSRNWTAFEIDSEDDSLTIEEMQALSVAAQQRPKRATLATTELSESFQSFHDGECDYSNDSDMLTIPYSCKKPDSSGTPFTVSMHMSPPSPNLSPSDSRISSRRGSLLRQDMMFLQKVSEEESFSLDSEKPKDRRSTESENDTSMEALSSVTRPSAGDPWNMTNTLEFISRRKSLEPMYRTLSSRTRYVKVPIAKMDRWTQISYSEIKRETGWVKPVTCVHPRRRMVRNQAIDAMSSEDSATGPPKTAGSADQSTGVPRIVCERDTEPSQTGPEGEVSITVSDGNLLYPREGGDSLPPVRQSTIDTVDSGIADSPKDTLIPSPVTTPKTRFISGHRKVTRSRYRGKIPLDPQLVSGSPNTAHDEDVGRNLFFRRRTVSAGLRFSMSISETRRRALSREDSGDKSVRTPRRSPRAISSKRRVRFSRKVMLYRRSSSRTSRSVSHETPTPLAPPGQQTSSPHVGFRKPSPSASPLSGSKTSRQDHWEVRPGIIINLQEDSPGGNKNPFFADYFARQESANSPVRDARTNSRSSDWDKVYGEVFRDMAADSVDKKTDEDRGYCSLIETPSASDRSASASRPFVFQANSFSQDNLSSFDTCSEIAHLTEDGPADFTHLGLAEDFRFHRPSISIEDEVFIPLTSKMSPNEDDFLDGFLEYQDSLTSDVSGIDAAVSHQLPDPYRCRAVGAGLHEGRVGIQNNFQVLTETNGNDCLSVSIKGPRPHTVSETNVTFTGDNLYEILYEVTRPGNYIITVKWGDFNIPSSPFLCTVTY